MEVTVNDSETPLPIPTAAGDGGGGVEDGDKFSDLPAGVARHIFSFLDDVDAIDVIRTSVVARSWRHLWTSMTCLNFNIDNPFWSDPPDWLPSDEKFTEYKDFVNWILMSQASSIRVQRSCLFYFNNGNDYTVHRWMAILSQREVKTINLNVGLHSSPVDLPHSLLTCNSLLSLTLQFRPHGALNLPTFASFSMLETLILHNITFSNSVLLRNFISSCPRLEFLYMKECGFPKFKILDIRSSTLKTLLIKNEWANEKSLVHCEVKVACPSLECVTFELLISASDFTLQEKNCLREADIFLGCPPVELENVEHYRTLMSKIIRQLSNVEVCKLTMPFYCYFNSMPDAVPDRLDISFNNLKYLEVYVGMNKWYMQSIINMLNYSPILETLIVEFDTNVPGPVAWNIPDDAIACLTNHLKTVKIRKFENIENKIEFVRFLLDHGQKLQDVSITWKEDVEKPMEIMRLIRALPASSPSVEVTFIEHF